LNTHKACGAFLKQFEDVRKFRKAKGTPTDAEQDLLRAMLAFACAGLDSMAKQLVRDALPSVISSDDGAAKIFVQRTKKVISKDGSLDLDLLLNSILSECPKDQFVADLVMDLTSRSLQSVDELFKVASFFNIPSRDLSNEPEGLKKIFKTRNQIAHEMDIDFSQPNRNRRPRSRDTMIEYVNTVFATAKSLMEKVDQKIVHTPKRS
jgi:hypothetical protein